MTPPPRFPADVVEAVRTAQVVGIRAGTGAHRVIGIWAVAVEGRVFVRSWSREPNGWHAAFRAEPEGTMTVDVREFPVRAVQTRSERLKAAADEAYLAKYRTPAALKYARDLCSAECRATTTELVPR